MKQRQKPQQHQQLRRKNKILRKLIKTPRRSANNKVISEYPFDDQIFGDTTQIRIFRGVFMLLSFYGPYRRIRSVYFFTVCDAVCTDTVFSCGAWLFIGVGCIFCCMSVSCVCVDFMLQISLCNCRSLICVTVQGFT